MHKIILTFFIGVMAALPLRAQTDGAAPLPADPETVIGKLPNGITYYLTSCDKAHFSLTEIL